MKTPSGTYSKQPILIAFLFVLSFTLSACGGSSSSSDEDTTTDIDSPTTSEDSEVSDSSDDADDSEDIEAGSDTADTDSLTRSFAIVDTNQTTCYDSSTGLVTSCNGAGHDADYSGNQPSYSVSGDGLVVTDNVTGLVWQQSSDYNNDGELNYADKLSQSDAATYCEGLTYGGQSNWRLPNIKEAYSLILFSGKDASNYSGSDTSTLMPFISAEFDWVFGDITTEEGINAGDRIIDAQYASSTLYVSTTMNNDPTMFGVNYVDGRIKGYPTHIKDFYVRCVADNESYGDNDFIDNEDQTVSDNATGLMWQKNDSEPYNWDEAVSECETSSTASYIDWRLPNSKELQSILDYTRSPDTDSDAAIDPIFNSTSFLNEESIIDWGYYWTSTTHVDNDDNGSNAAYVSFGRALGYMQNTILDVHGAGAQRSNDKLDVASEPGAQSATVNGIFYYKGPQGDILRENNKVRCVRNM